MEKEKKSGKEENAPADEGKAVVEGGKPAAGADPAPKAEAQGEADAQEAPARPGFLKRLAATVELHFGLTCCLLSFLFGAFAGDYFSQWRSVRMAEKVLFDKPEMAKMAVQKLADDLAILDRRMTDLIVDVQKPLLNQAYVIDNLASRLENSNAKAEEAMRRKGVPVPVSSSAKKDLLPGEGEWRDRLASEVIARAREAVKKDADQTPQDAKPDYGPGVTGEALTGRSSRVDK